VAILVEIGPAVRPVRETKKQKRRGKKLSVAPFSNIDFGQWLVFITVCTTSRDKVGIVHRSTVKNNKPKNFSILQEMHTVGAIRKFHVKSGNLCVLLTPTLGSATFISYLDVTLCTDSCIIDSFSI